MSLPPWARLVVLVACAKAAFGLVLYLSLGELRATPAVPVWVYAALTAAFATVGGTLVAGNRRDPRAAWLGGLLLLIASALAPVVNRVAGDVPFAAVVRPDAFLPAFIWMFVREFPSPLAPQPSRIVHGIAAVALVVGGLCAAANLSLVASPVSTVGDWRTPLLKDTVAGGWYWPLVFALSLLALPVLLWRARTAAADERPRVRLFVRGLALGLTPFALEVVAEGLFPAYSAFTSREPAHTVVATVLFGSLATVPFVTAYSVIFDRVMQVRVVLRAALQHMLARSMIVTLTLIPFAALALFLYSQRAQALASLFAGPRPLLLLGAAALGLAALRMRHRWLAAIDRRYFREPYDAQQILARFVGDLHAATPQQLATRIAHELDRTLHVTADVFLANDARTALRDARGERPPLAASSTLVELAVNDPMPMDVDLADPSSALHRLPEAEKRWILTNGVHLLVALKSGDGKLAGVLALSAKRSGLEFSALDRQLVAAVSAATSLALDNLRLRSTPLSPADPAARECLHCSRLNPADSEVCGCGGATAEAPVPHVLRGTFRLEQRLGAGGMGVVYRALDLNLGRDVAIKTLPRMGAAQAQRLRKEARAMAMVAHPNLATVYGIETWRDVPFLVEEYLAAGTLAHKLSLRRLSLAEALQLGITLSDALEHLHGARILHCDIKPSNIGFTQHGVVKLLDFGLARLLRDRRPPAEVLTATSPVEDAPTLVAASASGAFAGTPHYMSPEAVQGGRPSPVYDVWGLSVVLFEAIAGHRPFDGATGPEIFSRVMARDRPDLTREWPECPASVASVFNRLLALDPGERPRDPGSLKRQLVALRPVAQLV